MIARIAVDRVTAAVMTAFLAVIGMAGCALLRPVAPAAPVAPAVTACLPVAEDAALRLGCLTAEGDVPSPICETVLPSDEESAAFRSEGERLSVHATAGCRRLGAAVTESLPRVRMYSKALIKRMGAHRYFGVGHAYEMGDVWMVRVARRLDDLNGRTLDDLKRTLRHEASHTIGATEDSSHGWSANDYASICA